MLTCTCAIKGPEMCPHPHHSTRTWAWIDTPPRPAVPALSGTWIPADLNGDDPE